MRGADISGRIGELIIMDKSKMYSLKSATIRDINTDLVFPCYCCQNNKNGDLRENSPTCWTNCEYDRGPEGKSNFKPFFTLDGCAWTDFDGQPPVMSDEEIRSTYASIATRTKAIRETKEGPDKLVDDLIESFQKASFDSLDTQKHYQAMRSKVISLLSKVMRYNDDESDQELIEKLEKVTGSVASKLVPIMESMLLNLPEGNDEFKRKLVHHLIDMKCVRRPNNLLDAARAAKNWMRATGATHSELYRFLCRSIDEAESEYKELNPQCSGDHGGNTEEGTTEDVK